MLCLSFHDMCQSSLADSERARGLEKSGSSHCGGDPPSPLHKRLSSFRTVKFQPPFSSWEKVYVKSYDCCRPMKVEWSLLNLSFSLLAKIPVILSLRFPGRVNKDVSSAW